MTKRGKKSSKRVDSKTSEDLKNSKGSKVSKSIARSTLTEKCKKKKNAKGTNNSGPRKK